jgi:hypothetical protein
MVARSRGFCQVNDTRVDSLAPGVYGDSADQLDTCLPRDLAAQEQPGLDIGE